MRSRPAKGAHRGGAKRCSRRAAAAGRWYPRVTLEDGGAPWVRPAMLGEMHGQDRVLFLCEKRLLGRVSRSIYGAAERRARTISTRPNTSCACPSLIRLEHGQTAGSAPQGQGPGVTGTVESGRPPPGRVGRFVPTGNYPVLPESLRPFGTTFHYGKN